jgi:hypothetical protein
VFLLILAHTKPERERDDDDDDEREILIGDFLERDFFS